ncbi:MAG: hypothetical protein ACI8YQ_001756 [Polaribacter sp.]|jgi:hypothetical protein
MKNNYLHPSEEAGKQFYLRQHKGPVVMLNLLRFREIADYSETPELAPSNPISGKAAYKLYMKHTVPFLEKSRGEVLFSGSAGSFLIGPLEESWDSVLVVRHQSAEVFLAFARDEGYLKGMGHRRAALADSRLLPMSEGDMFTPPP